MKKLRRKFSKEFKIEAVKLLKDGQGSVAEVARNLGVHENQLRRWKDEFATDPKEAFPGNGHMKSDEEEIRRLRRELARVTEERNILKKAIEVFSRQGIL